MTEFEAEDVRPARFGRVGSALQRAEQIYLRVLRAAILIIATGLILYAAWLGATGHWKVFQSPDSVQEQVASVAADELTNAAMPVRPRETETGPRVNPTQQRYYASFVDRYYDLFRNSFEPFRQNDDRRLNRDEFDDAYIDSQARLQAAASGEIDFAADRADLETLLQVMTEAPERFASAEESSVRGPSIGKVGIATALIVLTGIIHPMDALSAGLCKFRTPKQYIQWRILKELNLTARYSAPSKIVISTYCISVVRRIRRRHRGKETTFLLVTLTGKSPCGMP